MRKNYILFLLSFIPQVCFSQTDGKIIYGKVISQAVDLQGINVMNLVNEKSVVTNSNGEFQILAKEDDLLILSSERFEYKRKRIEKEDFDSKIIQIEMVSRPGQLEEVVIVDYQNFNAVNLGVLEKPAKQFTPAERRLQTAGDFKPIHLLAILGGTLPVDPIINAINGRTKRLKKEISVEKREFRLKEIDSFYEDIFYLETLKIPKENIMGFKYFLTEDEDFALLLSQKNKALIEMYVVRSATDYLNLLSDEKP